MGVTPCHANSSALRNLLSADWCNDKRDSVCVMDRDWSCLPVFNTGNIRAASFVVRDRIISIRHASNIHNTFSNRGTFHTDYSSHRLHPENTSCKPWKWFQCNNCLLHMILCQHTWLHRQCLGSVFIRSMSTPQPSISRKHWHPRLDKDYSFCHPTSLNILLIVVKCTL